MIRNTFLNTNSKTKYFLLLILITLSINERILLLYVFTRIEQHFFKNENMFFNISIEFFLTYLEDSFDRKFCKNVNNFFLEKY